MHAHLSQRSQALDRLCRFKLLEPAEERRLFRSLKRASDYARQPTKQAARVADIRNQIALSNLRLVVSAAKRFAGSQFSMENLVSEASLLLLRCVERFDASRGTRFSTYATRALTHHFVRLRKREVRRAMRSLPSVVPARPMHSRGGNEALDRLIDREDRQRLAARFANLPERDRTLLEARFGLSGIAAPKTFREIAASHGLSKEWGRVATTDAIKRLRNSLQRKDPR
jgi:RNA polymerase primary sigma factor